MPTPVLPNARVLAREALVAQTSLSVLLPSDQVATSTPPTPTYPLIVLAIVDDSELAPDRAFVRVQVNIWGKSGGIKDTKEVFDIAAVVRSIARDLRGTWSSGKISNSAPGQILDAPDPVTGRARAIVDLLLETNP
jgi:hypothetical protein